MDKYKTKKQYCIIHRVFIYRSEWYYPTFGQMESRVNSIKIARGQAPTTYTGASTTYHQFFPFWTTCYYKPQLNPDQTTADI